MEHYNSQEVGTHLAEALIASVDGQACPGQLPPMSAAKVVGCMIPGGWSFALAASPAAAAHRDTHPPPGGKALISKGELGVVRLVLDAQSHIHSIAYLGPQPPQALKLASLVGLPISYVKEELGLSDSTLQLSAADGAVSMSGLMTKDHVTLGVEVSQDVLSVLSQPWGELLYHDGFAALHKQLLKQCSGLSKEDAVLQAQASVLSCMKGCSSELPAYNLPVMTQ